MDIVNTLLTPSHRTLFLLMLIHMEQSSSQLYLGPTKQQLQLQPVNMNTTPSTSQLEMCTTTSGKHTKTPSFWSGSYQFLRVPERTPITKPSKTSTADCSMGVLPQSTIPSNHSCATGTLFSVPITTFGGQFMASVHTLRTIQNKQLHQGSFTIGV